MGLDVIIATVTIKLLLSAGIGATIGAGAKKATLWWQRRKESKLREKIR